MFPKLFLFQEEKLGQGATAARHRGPAVHEVTINHVVLMLISGGTIGVSAVHQVTIG